MKSPSFGNCTYSEKQRDVVSADGSSVGLRRQSVEVFKYLADNQGEVLSREEIHAKVWKNTAVTDDSLNQCISEIRKAIDDQDRQILKTVQRRGYMLCADSPREADPVEQPQLPPTNQWSRLIIALSVFGLVAVLLIGARLFNEYTNSSSSDNNNSSTDTAAYLGNATQGDASQGNSPQTDAFTDNSTTVDTTLEQHRAPEISIEINGENTGYIASVASNTRVALSRYRSVTVVNHQNPDYTLQLSTIGSDAADISIELTSTSDDTLVFAEIISPVELYSDDTASGNDQPRSAGTRIAGMVASPGGGAVSRHLVQTARGLTADELHRSQCYAYGYGCTNCSGELDPITKIADECLAKILEDDPADARAWALQSTLYANQYFWSSALAEPARTSLKHRAHLPELAIAAANKAEKYSDGTDTSVYFGMSQAYVSACEIDKLHTAVDRGLQINPDDPLLLGIFGSWLAYSGDWDAGVDMVKRALEIEPRYYKHWWLYPIAKRHYARGEYDQALTVFRQSYNERNWLSHLQLAYTLPYLDRIDEAIEERIAFEQLYPGVTIEKVLQFYKTYCFEDPFLEKIKWALVAAGLPSRGSSEEPDGIQPPEAQIKTINGFDAEYMDVGSGTPIVFVHGALSDYRAWNHYQNPISENHRYISYSMRYAGSQPWPDNGEKIGLATDAQDLIALVEALELGPVFTVSWSAGGRVSGLAALLRPDLFQGNIHFEPIVTELANTTDPIALKSKDALYNRYGDVRKEYAAGNHERGNELLLEAVFELEPGQYNTEIMPLRAMNRDSARYMGIRVSAPNYSDLNCEKLRDTEVPTLVVAGEKTNAWWQHVISRYHECIPGSQFQVMRGVNHAGPIRQPEIFTDIVLGFVESIAK